MKSGDIGVYVNPFSPPHAGDIVKITAASQGRANLCYLKNPEECEFGVSLKSIYTLQEYEAYLEEVIDAAEVLKTVIRHYRSEQP